MRKIRPNCLRKIPGTSQERLRSMDIKKTFEVPRRHGIRPKLFKHVLATVNNLIPTLLSWQIAKSAHPGQVLKDFAVGGHSHESQHGVQGGSAGAKTSPASA